MLTALKVNPWPRPQSAREAAMQAALAGFQSYAAAYALTAKAATASAALSSLTGVAVCMHIVVRRSGELWAVVRMLWGVLCRCTDTF